MGVRQDMDELDQPSKVVGKYDIFEDRVNSLLARWRLFKEQRANKEIDGVTIVISDEGIIKACMAEINDGFTQHLMEPEPSKEYECSECGNTEYNCACPPKGHK